MKAAVNISNIYRNKNLAAFFFREQSYKTLEELVERSCLGRQETLNYLDEQLQDNDLDEVELDFYDMTLEELANQYCIDIEEDEEENVVEL